MIPKTIATRAPDPEHAVRVGAFLLVFVSGIAFLLTQKLFFSSLTLLVAALIAWFAEGRNTRGSWWEIASFVYFLFFFFDIWRISGSLAPALVHLFIFILINKIFNLQNDRDYYQLYLLTFLSILAASSLSAEIEMFYMILLYITLLVWNIASLTLLKEWKAAGTSEPFPFSLFHPFYWVAVLASSITAFIIAMGIFFVLPRIQLGYFSNLSAGKTQHVSGFSQTVSLGDISDIQDDKDIVMRVRVTGTEPLPAGRLYWRGISFDYYNGHSWSTRNPGTRFLYSDSFSNFYNSKDYQDETALLKQEFFLEPLDTRIVFGAEKIVRIHGNFRGITRDDNGTLTGMNRPENYEVYSRIHTWPVPVLRAVRVRVPDNIKRYYLQLPTASPDMNHLAWSVAGSGQTTIDRVLAIQRYLENNYTYTTHDLPQDAEDPVSVFLFQKKAGHCEYFATSMVLLLRQLGIPARIVNGFLEGEFNNIGDFYLVRQTDAHSWVEVYFNGVWVTFDPSPRMASAGPSSIWSSLNFRRILDSVNFFWDRYILIFSGQDQLNALSAAKDKYQQIKKVAKKFAGNASNWTTKLNHLWQHNRLLLEISLLILGIALLCLRLYLRGRRKQEVSRTPILFYQEMLFLLEKKGFIRSPAVTPGEFVGQLSEEIPAEYTQDIQQITALFYKARFGNQILSRSEQDVVRSSLDRLEHMQ